MVAGGVTFATRMTALLLLLAATAPDVNMLSLETGTVLVQSPPSWGGLWSPEALTDGDPATGWCSAVVTKGPFSFVYELEQRTVLTSLDVNNANAEEPSNPGVSASSLEVWVSSVGPSAGFTRVWLMPLKKLGAGHANLPKDTVARWVRLVIPGNWGDSRYTELMEVSLLGHPLEPAPPRKLAGVWRLEGGGLLRLSGEGAALTGCATWPDKVWSITGEARGRAALLTWTDEGAEGTATLALRDDGELRGRWREPGTSGAWVGTKRAEAELDCRTVADDLRFSRRLRSEPLGLTLTGVSFDLGTEELRLEARHELGALERMLLASGSRVRLLVLGRTSEAAPDELKRCERRAQRLLGHLQKAGVPTSAVDVGVGLLKVGSAVQLEPRVEVLLLP